MKNVHDIVFRDGIVIPKGSLEYLGCYEAADGSFAYEFRETAVTGSTSGISVLLDEMIRGVRDKQRLEGKNELG